MAEDPANDPLIRAVTGVFRRHGFDGTTLARLSDATGLAKASLYYRFPGGKHEMAHAVMEDSAVRFEDAVVGALEGTGESPRTRLESMRDALRRFFADGSLACIFEVLSRGDVLPETRARGRAAVDRWTDALVRVLEAHGLAPAEARRRADVAVVLVAGCLVLARIQDDASVFARLVGTLPDQLLDGGG